MIISRLKQLIKLFDLNLGQIEMLSGLNRRVIRGCMTDNKLPYYAEDSIRLEELVGIFEEIQECPNSWERIKCLTKGFVSKNVTRGIFHRLCNVNERTVNRYIHLLVKTGVLISNDIDINKSDSFKIVKIIPDSSSVKKLHEHIESSSNDLIPEDCNHIDLLIKALEHSKRSVILKIENDQLKRRVLALQKNEFESPLREDAKTLAASVVSIENYLKHIKKEDLRSAFENLIEQARMILEMY